MRILVALIAGGLAAIGGYFALGLDYEALEGEARDGMTDPWGLRYDCDEITRPEDTTPVIAREIDCDSIPATPDGSQFVEPTEEQILNHLRDHVPGGDQTTTHYWPERPSLPMSYRVPVQTSWLKETRVGVSGPRGSMEMRVFISTRPVTVVITLGGIFLAGAGVGFFAYDSIQRAVRRRQSRGLIRDTEPEQVAA